MNVFINQQPTELPAQASVQDALAVLVPTPPFAVAVNTLFVPRTQYAAHLLQDGDRVEVIAPVTGG
ncbi:sulfur carrier protein ThiS [Alicycliphilus denitrificans]|uniref:sulfur carrier protein ThiS n=1 Tax=Alicycliphilus denitrificans TaxID=179636 RepID=UPI00384CCE69